MPLKHYSFLLAVLLGCTFAHAQTKSWTPINKNEMPAGTERRLALVIGNKDYVRTDARLRNPVNDATDMTAALESLGFDVITYNNLNLAGLKKAVDEFGTRLSDYNVALFYYSGHALQFNGENYLVPVDATLQTLSDAEDDCLRLGRIMGKMKAANVKNNIVFLDACRNNPFPKSDGSRAKPAAGLIIPNNPAGTMVVFATEEGSTADDNVGERNGLFTGELLKHLTIPNLSISDIVLNTRQGVYQRSGEHQLPADYNKMLGAFYFIKKESIVEPPKPVAANVDHNYATQPTSPETKIEENPISKTAVGLNLSGWSWSRKPVVNDKSNITGLITFRISVDKNGRIKNIVNLSSTVTDYAIISQYKDAVRELTFIPRSSNIPDESIGTITFKIVP